MGHEVPPPGTSDAPASATRARRAAPLLIHAGYMLCALLLVEIYTARTRWVSPGMEAFTHDQAPYPFRFRILIPWLARALEQATHLPLPWIYFAIATLSVFGLLTVFARDLATTLPAGTARVLAFGMLYPVAWNYLGLNLMYLPFDFPCLFFFVLALHALRTRNWALYYPVFLLATINRETTWFLTVVLLATGIGRLRPRALVAHVAAQAAIWIAVKFALFALFPAADRTLAANMWWKNADTFHGMFTLTGTGAKDWAKLLLMFGGLWMVAPFCLRRAPRFDRRALLAAPVFILPMFVVGTIDEARLYPELIPLVLVPVLLALAETLERGPSLRAGGRMRAPL